MITCFEAKLVTKYNESTTVMHMECSLPVRRRIQDRVPDACSKHVRNVVVFWILAHGMRTCVCNASRAAAGPKIEKIESMHSLV